MDKNNMVIRRFQEQDAEELSIIICRNYREINIKEYSFEEMEELACIYNADKVKEIASWANLYVVCNNDEVVGCGGIGPYYDSLEKSIIVTVFVKPEYHGCGIGKIIVQALEKDIYFTRAKETMLFASLTADKFYLAMGYSYVEGERVVTEENNILMAKHNIC